MSKIHKNLHQLHKPSALKHNGSVSTDGITIDSTLAQEYPDVVVQKAIELKANNQIIDDNGNVQGDLLSDQMYLYYARRFHNRTLTIDMKYLADSLIHGCPTDDPDWIGFSYEEILQMESAGCTIPEEVLRWAHAQQDSDVTSYIIVSENDPELEDISAEDGKNADSENTIKYKLNQYIVKSENSLERTENQIEEFNSSMDLVKTLRNNKQKSIQDKLKDIENLNKEWKNLDEKKSQGKLTKSERKRYKELGKQINKSNVGFVDEFKLYSAELDKFLDSIDGMNGKIETNTKLNQEMVNISKALNNFEESISQNKKTHSVATMHTGNGLLAEFAIGVDKINLQKIAIEDAGNLYVANNSMIKEVSDSETKDIANLAVKYNKTVSNTDNLDEDIQTNVEKSDKEDNNIKVSDESENSETDESNVDFKDENNDNKYNVSVKFSFENALRASSISRNVTEKMRAQNSDTKSEDKNLQKAQKDADKDIKTLLKEIKNVEQKHESNLLKEDTLVSKIDILNAKDEKAIANKEAIESKAVEEFDVQIPPVEDTTQERNIISSEFSNIDNEEKIANNKLKKTINQGSVSTQKSQNLSKVLKNKSQDLEKTEINGKQVGENTVIVGVGTGVLGVKDTTYGIVKCNTGLGLMANPFTYSLGMLEFILGAFLIDLGTLEIGSGLDATINGANAIEESAKAKDTVQDSDAEVKEVLQDIKDNNNEIKQAGNINLIKISLPDNDTNNTDFVVGVSENVKSKKSTISEDKSNSENINIADNDINPEIEAQQPQEVSQNTPVSEKIEKKISKQIGLVNITQNDISNNIENMKYASKQAEKEVAVNEDDNSEDETAMASSASVNVNLHNSVETDDKADRKLTRFNNDSIIESKKRLRRVNAVKEIAKK